MIDIDTAFKIGGQPLGSITGFSSVRALISALLPNVFVLAGLIILAFFIFGSISYIATAGNPEAQKKNKDVITNAVIGFLLIFAAYWIIQIIETITGIKILTQ